MENIDIIEITRENIDKEHIGCAIGNTGDAKACSDMKKSWMKERFGEGYHFWRLDTRGKALIEGTPIENAWAPVDGNNLLFIDCYWVSGQFKGHGTGRRLLEVAEKYAASNGMDGLVAVAAAKKRGYVMDAHYYAHLGFEKTDEAAPDFLLMAKLFKNKTSLPRFNKCVNNTINNDGILVYYTHHCPHTEKFKEILKQAAQEHHLSFSSIFINTKEDARQVPSPFTTWAMYYNGKFVTNEIYTPGKMLKLAGK